MNRVSGKEKSDRPLKRRGLQRPLSRLRKEKEAGSWGRGRPWLAK
jgi:hypothetical protein